jgi:competence protein ComEC
MSSLLLIAYLLGRLARADRLLLLTALAMLFANPRLLRDDVGFQLSFLAFAGLLAYFEPIKLCLGRYLKHKRLALPLEVVSLTLAAQVLAWPILALNFGQISWVAPLSNLLVLWALGPMMILAFIGLLLASILPPVWVLAPALLLAKYQNAVARVIGEWPYGIIDAQGWSVYLFILYYCGIMLITLRTNSVSHDQNPTRQNR